MQSKNNLITGSNKHFGSVGKYFSFDSKGSYTMIDDVYVGQYAIKKYKDPLKHEKATLTAIAIEEIIAQELGAEIKDMTRIIPNIRKVIAPVINASFYLQQAECSVNLQSIPPASDGLWQSNLSVNALTEEFHTEDDSTYTGIKIPNQEHEQKLSKYHFVLNFSNKHNVAIQLIAGTTFLFSGKLSTHRQSCNVEYDPKKELFINFGFYGTNKLFTYLKDSFMRKIN